MRWLPRTLAVLVIVTALLPLLLHFRLDRIQFTKEEDDNASWVRPLAEVKGTAPWTLFYHIYLPPPDHKDPQGDGYEHASAIVDEQLSMVGQSFAASNGHKPVLYYTVIGDQFHNQTWFDDTCHRNNLNCILLRHARQGQEDVTLQSLYNFCKAVPSQAVIYLHTKGSFHANGPKFATQDIWRQRLTQAATHYLCLTAVASGGDNNDSQRQCETCSLLLQPLPGIHYPGNMFATRCTYVRRLLPPNGFAQRMDEVVQEYKKIRDSTKRLNTTFFPQMPHMMGRNRFAAEQWIGSHPLLRSPCDVSAHVTANMSEWLHPTKTKTLSSTNFSLGQHPMYPIEYSHWDYFRYGKRGSTVLNNPALRLRDYFLLPGQLLKWYSLYRQVPPLDSWIWKWFPDSDVWLEKIREHGAAFWVHDDDDWLPPLVELSV